MDDSSLKRRVMGIVTGVMVGASMFLGAGMVLLLSTPGAQAQESAAMVAVDIPAARPSETTEPTGAGGHVQAIELASRPSAPNAVRAPSMAKVSAKAASSSKGAPKAGGDIIHDAPF